MSLWTWLFGKQPEPESLRFVKGLSEKDHPKIYTDFGILGYLFRFSLIFKEVTIKLDYNSIRNNWRMEILAEGGFLFWHDYSWQAVDYLVERYKLLAILNPALAEHEKKNQQIEDSKCKIKEKYIKKI